MDIVSSGTQKPLLTKSLVVQIVSVHTGVIGEIFIYLASSVGFYIYTSFICFICFILLCREHVECLSRSNAISVVKVHGPSEQIDSDVKVFITCILTPPQEK